MDTIDAFLESNPHLQRADEPPLGRSGELTLSVLVQGVTPTGVVFRFLNTDYKVLRDDVLGLDARGDQAGGGHAALLRLKRDATLVISQQVSAADVAAAVPFSLLRASTATADQSETSPKEARWRAATGFAAPLVAGVTWEELDAYATGSKSFCGGKRTDDSLVDDG